jgi:DNA-binding XRE family transcriptional regulator
MNHPDAVLQYVGQNIRFYRNQHQLSQQELAERAGVSRRTIASLETGMVNISLTKLDDRKCFRCEFQATCDSTRACGFCDR